MERIKKYRKITYESWKKYMFLQFDKKVLKENFYENFKKEKKVVLNFKGIKKIGRKHY